MPPIVSTAVLGVAAAVALVALIRGAGQYAVQLRLASGQYDDFYRQAQRVIGDRRTPEVVLDFISRFAAEAGRPRLARNLLRHFLLGRKTPSPTADSKALGRALAEMPTDLRETFSKMVACGYVSGAVSDPFLSDIHRHVFPLIISTSGRDDSPPSVERAVAVAQDFSSSLSGAREAVPA
jgi:nitrogen fixation-related uncharacterized protein